MREYTKKGWAKPAVNVINIFTYEFFIWTSISEAFSSYMHIEKAAETKFFSYGIFQFRILPKTFLYRE